MPFTNYGALALSKTKHTGLHLQTYQWKWNKCISLFIKMNEWIVKQFSRVLLSGNHHPSSRYVHSAAVRGGHPSNLAPGYSFEEKKMRADNVFILKLPNIWSDCSFILQCREVDWPLPAVEVASYLCIQIMRDFVLCSNRDFWPFCLHCFPRTTPSFDGDYALTDGLSFNNEAGDPKHKLCTVFLSCTLKEGNLVCRQYR